MSNLLWHLTLSFIFIIESQIETLPLKWKFLLSLLLCHCWRLALLIFSLVKFPKCKSSLALCGSPQGHHKIVLFFFTCEQMLLQSIFTERILNDKANIAKWTACVKLTQARFNYLCTYGVELSAVESVNSKYFSPPMLLLWCCVLHFQDGTTPLHIACQEGHLPVVQHLIAAKADVNTPAEVVYALVLLIWCITHFSRVCSYLDLHGEKPSANLESSVE